MSGSESGGLARGAGIEFGFGHVERMDEYRMARRVLMADVSEGGYWVDRG